LKPKVSIKERNLIRSCKRGSTKAQFELYSLYYKGMYNVSLRIVRDNAEAEDIMQEAFLTAFDKIESFKAEVTFGAWLKKIVVNKSLDALRRRKLKTEEMNEGYMRMPDEEDETLKVLDKVVLIKRVVAQLPETQRLLITLHLFEGYPHEEIAQMLDMKHGAVRTAYLRAKNKLQDLLEEKMQEVSN
jgi:RNA polymerase sigma factor (sigma-70 family)